MKSAEKTGMIIVAVALLVMTGIILFHKPEYEISEKTNATHFYVKAFSLLVWPSPDLYRDFDRKAKDIIDNGWEGVDKDLENVLAKNQAAIDEFEKAVKLKKCDLTFGKEYKYLVDKEPPYLYLKKGKKLSILVMLKGRHYETQQHFDKAINLYLSCLTLAQHVSQDNTTLSKGFAMLIEKKSCIPLRQYVDSEKARKETCLNIANYLMKYEKERFSLKEIVEDERKVFDSIVDRLVDGFQKETQKAVESDPDRRKTETFIAEFRTRSKQLADKYYGGYAKAMESNDEADWKSVQSEVELLQESSIPAIRNREISKLLEEGFTKVTPEETAKVAARGLLAMTIIKFQGLAESYHSNLKELEELKARANRQ